MRRVGLVGQDQLSVVAFKFAFHRVFHYHFFNVDCRLFIKRLTFVEIQLWCQDLFIEKDLPFSFQF
jgi:hypothetical protein